jgi:DNA-binding Lrp family transcriptional regulator
MVKEQFLMVPYSLLSIKDLKDGDKLLLSLIQSLNKTNNGCLISNKYLGKLFNISRTAASERVSKLKSLGYIETSSYTFNNKTFRKIIPTFKEMESVNLMEVVGEVERDSRLSLNPHITKLGTIISDTLDKSLDKTLHITGGTSLYQYQKQKENGNQ